MDRVIVYIDGFNLYHGLKDKGWKHYLWLDMPVFARKLLAPVGQDLLAVKYFTARVGRPQDSQRRQSLYLDALALRGGLEIIFGDCIYNDESCNGCARTWKRQEEKMTDVGIAAHMLRDAYRDEFDVAILVSADTDLVPAVKMITRDPEHRGKKVVVARPPMRRSHMLNKHATMQFGTDESMYATSQMPDMIQGDRVVLARPPQWAAPTTSQ